ncbi:MvdC/MvdD family ATP grasp protein [Streptomyces platensis]
MAEFPLRLTLAASLSGNRWHGTLNHDRRTLDLASVRSVYHRRPTRPRSPEQMTAGARKVAENEARWGCGGLLTALPCRWLPPPGRAADAEYKPLQLPSRRRGAERSPHPERTRVTSPIGDH